MRKLINYHGETGTKKACADEENIPPASTDSLFTSPLPGPDRPSKSNPALVSPPSPSKRRQAVSHYCDTESSPSKKRDVAGVHPVGLLAEERGLLFGNNTNTAKSKGALLSKKSVKVNQESCCGQGTIPDEERATKTEARRMPSQVWVEIG